MLVAFSLLAPIAFVPALARPQILPRILRGVRNDKGAEGDKESLYLMSCDYEALLTHGHGHGSLS